jgi:hypothetical protein
LKCDHVLGYRKRIGPTGKKTFNILVDQCLKCKILVPKYPSKLTYEESNWLKRYNKRISKEK